MSLRVLHGDCRNVLASLPADSVHCCVTSPPYWGLRSYGVGIENGEIGLEPTFTEFIDKMVEVFREVRRVLRPDGTLWLNLGDSYSHGGCGSRDAERWPKQSRNDHRVEHAKTSDLKPKDLCGIPWRVAFALQADGWWLRQDIIWSKPNPMPESVTDRCTKAHEYLFLLTKSARYYFDSCAIAETAVADHPPGNKSHKGLSAYEGGALEHRTKAGLVAYSERQRPIVSDDRKELRSDIESRHRSAIDGGQSLKAAPNGTRNKRSVWEIATSPFPEAHFATFPPALVEPCIKAGTSEKGCCGKCGAPWERETKTEYDNPGNRTTNGPRSTENREFTAGFGQRLEKRTETLGWHPTCKCGAAVVPATVLDCFGGAGTTGLVADRLQRNGIIIELNPTYAEMARRRITSDAPLFALAAE